MFNKIKMLFNGPPNIIPLKKEEKAPDSEPRTEILAGGFVYEYPYTKNGLTFSSNNIQKLTPLIINAKTPEDEQILDILIPQVIELEVSQVIEAIERKQKMIMEQSKKV